MKNSQYVNLATVNIAEMVRLTFLEQMPQHGNEAAEVITLSMNIEFLKNLHEVIGKTLSDHAENVANVTKMKDVN